MRGTFRGDEIVPSEGTEVAGGSLVSQTAFGANVRGGQGSNPTSVTYCCYLTFLRTKVLHLDVEI